MPGPYPDNEVWLNHLLTGEHAGANENDLLAPPIEWRSYGSLELPG